MTGRPDGVRVFIYRTADDGRRRQEDDAAAAARPAWAPSLLRRRPSPALEKNPMRAVDHGAWIIHLW